jgi:hypothetical protein
VNLNARSVWKMTKRSAPRSAQIVSLVETQILEFAGWQDRVDAVVSHRANSSSLQDLAAGGDRITQIQVALVELFIQATTIR